MVAPQIGRVDLVLAAAEYGQPRAGSSVMIGQTERKKRGSRPLYVRAQGDRRLGCTRQMARAEPAFAARVAELGDRLLIP